MGLEPIKGASLDAEYSVIGCLLLEPKIIGEMLTKVRSEDFTESALRTIYQAAAHLFAQGRSADAVAIRQMIGTEYQPLMLSCMDIVAATGNWRSYVDTMLEQTRVYRLRMLSAELENIQSTDDAREIIAQAGEILSVKNHKKVITMQAALQNFFKEQSEKRRFLQFGFSRLDKRTYSDFGDFVVVAGRPSAGKTALALCMAQTLAEQANVGFYSLETSASKLFDRMIASNCIVDFSAIKRRKINPEQMQRVVEHKKDIASSQIEFINASGMTVQEILAIALARGHKVVFVDYLQLVRARGRDRFEQVTNVSVELHTMAQTHGILVVALSQLSRPANKSAFDNAPTLTDLRESGQIEQDADAVLALYLADSENNNGDRKLRVLKNKEGKLGEFTLYFDGDIQLFYDDLNEAAELKEKKERTEYEQTRIC